MDLDIGKNTDRISKLPDALLCHILSFLPTKHSVGTSVLSKRWENLWAFVPTLDFDDSDLFQPHDEEDEDEDMLKFMNFVNRVLLLSDVMCLEKFTLSLDSFCNFDLVDTWIATAIKRNVKTLQIGFHLEDICYIEYPILLPQRIFTSKTLVRLDLAGVVLLDIGSPVWLPSLKFLELSEIRYASDDSVKKLLHGCPSLEELTVDMWVWGLQYHPNLFSISVPTLKSLSITRFVDVGSLDEEFSDQLYKLEINAPELEHLYVSDNLTDEFYFADFSSLLTADIEIEPPSTRLDGSSDCDSRIYKILSAIANVKSLKFTTSSAIDYVLPAFPNLTNLQLRSDCESTWNLNMLKGFLEYSANLEVLIIEGEVQVGSSEVLSLPSDVPQCLRLHLKKVVISTFEGKEHTLKMIKYLLKNASVLKEMTVNCRRSNGCFCSDLAKYPRGSKKCKLNLIH